MYDFLIVGAGLYGATFARIALDAGKSVLVVDKRSYLGGNCADDMVDGILVQKHGGHIFHTNNKAAWDFINRFGEFWQYTHQVVAFNDGQYIQLPINLSTLMSLYPDEEFLRYSEGMPDSAKRLIGRVKRNGQQDNFESFVVGEVGERVYKAIFKGYTEKQWGVSCKELPASIAKRIPIRYNFDGRYFSDLYQGMPVKGYSELIKNMLRGASVMLGVDYKAGSALDNSAKKTVYSGPIDALYNYKFGKLDYRSLRWEHEALDVDDALGAPTINYTSEHILKTRTIEWKHFMKSPPKGRTIVSHEFPQKWEVGRERYYPINNERNNRLAKVYKGMAEGDGYVVGGRLGSYAYLDMHQAISMGMRDAQRVLQVP